MLRVNELHRYIIIKQNELHLANPDPDTPVLCKENIFFYILTGNILNHLIYSIFENV